MKAARVVSFIIRMSGRLNRTYVIVRTAIWVATRKYSLSSQCVDTVLTDGSDVTARIKAVSDTGDEGFFCAFI